MMLRAYALTADENGRFQEAAASYEAALLADPADLEATVNLAVLYWQAAGRSRAASGSLPQEFLKHAQKRLQELLGSATDRAASEGIPSGETPSGGERFAERAELRFWKKYITAADAGEPLQPSECRQLMQERPDYLEPAFVVFSDSSGQEAEPEAMRLLVDCSEQPTARGRYVTSIINAVMRKQRWHAGLAPTA
jgi:tetratricopeptide (TPR) repeat protein